MITLGRMSIADYCFVAYWALGSLI